jgi:hypothetical protein
MQITRSSIDTQKGPADWFTGDVYIDTVAAPAGSSTFAAANVHFTPGARTAWHTHPHGQTIFVTEGVGLCQHAGGPVEVIRPGDRIFFEQPCHLGPPRQRRGVRRGARQRRLTLQRDSRFPCEGAPSRDAGATLAFAWMRHSCGPERSLENLQLLCPGCHSQTENFAGRNRRRPAA